MKKHNRQVVMIVLALVVSIITVSAQHPPVASRLGAAPLPEVKGQPALDDYIERDLGLDGACDRIVDTMCIAECNGKGIPWGAPPPACPAPGSVPGNTMGPCGMGLLYGYTLTGDPSHLIGVLDFAEYAACYTYGTGEYRFATGTPHFLWFVSDILTHSPDYRDHAQSEFFEALELGTYGPAPYSTSSYLALISSVRSGDYINLRPYEMSDLLKSASIMGSEAQFNEIACWTMRDAIDSLDNTKWYSVLGPACGIFGLASSNLDYDPQAGAWADADSLTDMMDGLLAFQHPTGGGFVYSAQLTPPFDTASQSLQTTAYAILAMKALDPWRYASEITRAEDWIWSMQQPNGGFIAYEGGNENIQVDGEALWALLYQPEPVRDGDVDINKTHTPQDAQQTFMITLGMLEPTWRQQHAADCDGNDSVTSEDALCIFRQCLSAECACVDPIVQAPLCDKSLSVRHMLQQQHSGSINAFTREHNGTVEVVIDMASKAQIDAFGMDIVVPSGWKLKSKEFSAGIASWNAFNALQHENLVRIGAWTIDNPIVDGNLIRMTFSISDETSADRSIKIKRLVDDIQNFELNIY